MQVQPHQLGKRDLGVAVDEVAANLAAASLRLRTPALLRAHGLGHVLVVPVVRDLRHVHHVEVRVRVHHREIAAARLEKNAKGGDAFGLTLCWARRRASSGRHCRTVCQTLSNGRRCPNASRNVGLGVDVQSDFLESLGKLGAGSEIHHTVEKRAILDGMWSLQISGALLRAGRRCWVQGGVTGRSVQLSRCSAHAADDFKKRLKEPLAACRTRVERSAAWASPPSSCFYRERVPRFFLRQRWPPLADELGFEAG